MVGTIIIILNVFLILYISSVQATFSVQHFSVT
uniref:Uncharacterized protein n=1 Tax=Anguilla anguilla TaxID=7936 RepID=A0A0E9UYY0_ANGAN